MICSALPLPLEPEGRSNTITAHGASSWVDATGTQGCMQSPAAQPQSERSSCLVAHMLPTMATDG